MVGQHLGPYHVVEELSVGGMGEVFRARDTRLNREVALKVLPAPFASDAERLRRFEREAQLLAALNHPNIAHIYGLEAATGQPVLVMELVDGPTLADRIARGALSLDETLRLAGQIAGALEAAHQRGIVHRDLKPANIKVRPDGLVKVLDFGLAKALEPAGDPPQPDAVPTMTHLRPRDVGTQAGMILGTPAYMSPEQVRGLPADRQIDVWAFGCVVYEVLTGRAAFGRRTMSETLAAVLEKDVDWTLLPAATPSDLRRLLRRCLEKDVSRRLHDIADARLEIEDVVNAPAPIALELPAAGISRTRRARAAYAAAAVLAAAALAATLATVGGLPGDAPRELRFEIT
jgi:serine/threonine protein kinase